RCLAVLTEQFFVKARKAPQTILVCIIKAADADLAEKCPSKPCSYSCRLLIPRPFPAKNSKRKENI
ncbi:MAG: hypothetical protein II668_04970, partial [Oscillospiraceae bacterium]|nr:hypothetical protein [Oscillospiraceae bacterium]